MAARFHCVFFRGSLGEIALISSLTQPLMPASEPTLFIKATTTLCAFTVAVLGPGHSGIFFTFFHNKAWF